MAYDSIPRPEYPRPQFVRADWLCLNGDWGFEADPGDSGAARGLIEAASLTGTIRVPFCPESSLSGIGCSDFLNAVWYKREVTIPAAWRGNRVRLHFGAVDDEAWVWVNGREVGRHRGGYTPFTCDLDEVAAPGDRVTITVRARDDHRAVKPRGKQSCEYANFRCLYTRTTGIWQTVWMEPVPAVYLDRPRITPDVEGSRFHLELPLAGRRADDLRVRAVLSDDRGEVSRAEAGASRDFTPVLDLPVPADRRRLWAPGDPFLYTLRIELLDAAGGRLDAFDSYAGLRSLAIDGRRVRLNGRSVFQRLVLDQGFYPDGLYTAPTDDALKRDIELGLAAGFNGARLHQKVFEERYLYWADRLGYLVWGEFADWGSGGHGGASEEQRPTPTFITQWLEALQRDYSHPALVGWCGINETAEVRSDRIPVLDDVIRGMFLAAKAIDRTRPVLDASGYSHRVPETDVYDAHDYEQDPGVFRANHAGLEAGKPFYNGRGADWSTPYGGQPFFVSEFGGAWWNPDATPGTASWGYGNRPRTADEFLARFEALCGVLLEHPAMFGYCYTQLTDVFQEQNGLFRFDRTPKFDLARLRIAQQRRAAIED